MKMVSCIIRPDKLEAVASAMDKLNVIGMTLTDVRGFGRQKGQTERSPEGESTLRFISKVKLDIVMNDGDVDKVLAAIGEAARTGAVGDGKAFVVDVEGAMRIRTGEKGANAL